MMELNCNYNIIPIASAIWFSCLPSVSATLFDLSQLQWTLKNQNGTIQIPAAGPPTQAHLDLLNADIITEPLLGINDFTQRWIVEENWTYTANISPIVDTLDSATRKATLLVFYGIDTVANISIGGHPVAWVNNQFRQYIFDVSSLIESPSAKSDDNNLTISLESAWRYGLNVSARPDAEDFPGGSWFEYPIAYRWVRKTASDFGWDWGPAFVPSGIHKRAYFVTLSSTETEKLQLLDRDLLEAQESWSLDTADHEESFRDAPPSDYSALNLDLADTVFVEEFSLDIYKAGQSLSVRPDQNADWVVNFTLALRCGQQLPPGFLTLSFPELNATSAPFPVPSVPVSTNTPVWISVAWVIPDALPQRWYPHNLGTPKLYNISVSLDISESNVSLPQTNVINFTTTTGFRTIELIQSPYSRGDAAARGITPGDQWHFEVNGKAFYSLGTNIIPFDPFYARITTDKVKWILESAVLSGQNMVRVWGGGAYQPSSSGVSGGGYDFYSICDELGILAWSELIFSDTMYGINDFMLETIEPEVRQNVRRINRHPSNAQWAGGNEIEGIAIFDNNSFSNGHHYFNEFVTLFQHFLHDTVVSETKSVAYTDCSTTKGVLSLDPYVLRFNNGTAGEIYGNTERFNYDAIQAFNYDSYPRGRFVNEFGFHSMPSFYSWEEVLTSPDDFSFNSTVVMSRDHHPPPGDLTFPNPNAHEGQSQMMMAVEMWLPTPSTSNANHTFAQWCWSTQVFQAMTIVSQIAWYRRGAGSEENNLGALVWQLNDIWQGVSWSSIEYSGRWKVLQYGLAGAFSPILIYPFWTAATETLQVIAISDRWEEVQGAAQLTWYDWFGTGLTTSRFKFTVPSLNNSLVLEAVGLNSIVPAGKAVSEVWLLLNATVNLGNGKTVTSEQYFTPTSLANVNLVDPEIVVTRTQDFSFTLSAKGGVAPWTWIDHPAGTVGVFVDSATGVATNGFYLVPGIDRTLTFLLNQALSQTRPNPNDFLVRTLWDNTHDRS